MKPLSLNEEFQKTSKYGKLENIINNILRA